MKTVEITYRYASQPKEARALPKDAKAARQRLDEGSRTFASLLDNLSGKRGMARRIIEVDPDDLGLSSGASDVPRHRPFAAVLGCADARVPVELIFNEGPNDLFVIRVAGNGLGSEVLGSLKYAVEHLGGSMKLIVVLGHSGCGAVSAAVDVFLDPAGYLSLASQHALRGILDRLLLVVHASARKLHEVMGPDVVRHPGYRGALIETSIVANAAFSAYTLQQQLAEGRKETIRAAYGVYLLATREVWAPRSGSSECSGLADPPADLAAFSDFAGTVVQSQRIASMLRSDAP